MYYLLDKNNVIVAQYSKRLEGVPLAKIDAGEPIELGLDKFIDGALVRATAEEKQAHEARQQEGYAAMEASIRENQARAARTRYLDAYRKYQAAVNYGEFAKSEEVDAFVAALRDKDWSALDNVPNQLRYFLGEVSLDESGLREERA